MSLQGEATRQSQGCRRRHDFRRQNRQLFDFYLLGRSSNDQARRNPTNTLPRGYLLSVKRKHLWVPARASIEAVRSEVQDLLTYAEMLGTNQTAPVAMEGVLRRNDGDLETSNPSTRKRPHRTKTWLARLARWTHTTTRARVRVGT